MIQRKILTEPFTVPGKDFWGRKSSISFFPTETPGWHLKTSKGIVPIDFNIATYKKGRIIISEKDCPVNVYEHIGANRFAGFDHVGIYNDGYPWSPYLTAGQYLMELSSHARLTDTFIPTIEPKRKGSYCSHNHLDSSVGIKAGSPDLQMNVVSKWEHLPFYHEELSLRTLTENRLLEIFMARPQGLPKRKLFATIGERFFNWPHMKQVAWPDDFLTVQDVAYAFWLHRVQDIFGELSLADHKALPIGYVTSYMAGHYESLCAIKKAFS